MKGISKLVQIQEIKKDVSLVYFSTEYKFRVQILVYQDSGCKEYTMFGKSINELFQVDPTDELVTNLQFRDLLDVFIGKWVLVRTVGHTIIHIQPLIPIEIPVLLLGEDAIEQTVEREFVYETDSSDSGKSEFLIEDSLMEDSIEDSLVDAMVQFQHSLLI
jgi:hypothetical protein